MLPVAGAGAVAGAAVAATTLPADPSPTAAVSPVSPVPFDVDGLREDAAAGPARGDTGTPSPLAGAGTPTAAAVTPPPAATPSPSATPSATPTPTPTPTPAGFPPVEGCDATIPGDGVGNGELSDENLCAVGSGHRLRPDAAASVVALDAFYRAETGEGLIECVTDSYRSYEAQVDVYNRKPGLAAVPGTSEHGWGLALDVGCGANSFGGALYEWLDDNADDFGWENPDWAQPGGSTPEPWHWEFDPDSLT